MNPLAMRFKRCGHDVGAKYGFPDGQIIRDFGLGDFLENLIEDGDPAKEIALAALNYFCRNHGKREQVFQFGVFTVCTFLHKHHARLSGHPPRRTLEDLIQILDANGNDDALLCWADSHFG